MRTMLAASLLALPLLAVPVPGQQRVPTLDQQFGKRADELLAEIAAARLALDVEHDAKLVETRLNMSWISATNGESYDRQIDVLIALMEARADLFARTGEPERVAKALTQLLPDPTEIAQALSGDPKLRYEAPCAPSPLATAVEAALAGPKVAALRARYAPAGGASADDKLVEAVASMLRLGQDQELRNLGYLAVPALEVLALREGSAHESRGIDPLQWLAAVDHARAASVLERIGYRGDAMWRSRALTITTHVLGDRDAAWIEQAGSDPAARPAQPQWTAFLEANSSELGFLMQAGEALRMLAYHDALTPRLRDGLIALVRGPDSVLAATVVDRFKSIEARSIRPLLHAALQSSFAQVRERAANALSNAHDVAGLIGSVGDSSSSVRRAAATSMAPYSDSSTSSLQFPELDAAALSALRRLARDPVVDVRSAAAFVLGAHPACASERELRLELIRDPSPTVRTAVLNACVERDLRVELLEVAAGQAEPQALESVARAIRDWLQERGAGSTIGSYPAARRTVVAYLRNPAAKGLEAFSNWGVRADLFDDAEFRRVAIEVAPRSRESLRACLVELGNSQPGGRRSVPRQLDDVPDAALRTLVVEVFRTLLPQSESDLANLLRRGGAPLAAALEPLAFDATQPAPLRMLALACNLSWRGEVIGPRVTELAADPAWRSLDPEMQTLRALQGVMDGAAAELGNTLRALVTSRTAEPRFVQLVLITVVRTQALPPDVAVRVLQMDASEWRDWIGVQGGALQVLATPLDDATLATLLRLPVELREALADCAGRLREPRLLPWLREQLLTGSRSSSTTNLINAVANYLNDDAVAILLEVATQRADHRDNCLAALETIRRIRDEKARWDGRTTSEAARAKALAELLPLLDSSDEKVRAGAATSIGSLGGVEHSPRLVRMLQDKSPLAREAAQKAIDRLAAATAAAAGPGK